MTVGMNDSNSDDAVRCPYCHTTQDCEHLLLLVDTGDRWAKGGALGETFNARLNRLLEEGEDDPNFSEQEVFDDLLADVESLADEQFESDFEGGPGMSTDYAFYFCSSKRRTDEAVKSFAVH